MPDRVRTRRVEGVVLRHRDWGEADRILTLFTRQAGKVRAIAKGVRKTRSRKAGHLEPFMRSDILLARGRDFDILTQAQVIEPYLPLRENLVLLGYASYVVELVDRFTFDEEDNPALYHLLCDTLSRLSQAEDPFLTLRYFDLRLLEEAGYRPQLFQCLGCGQEIRPQDQYFSAAQGGVLCPACGENAPERRPVSLDALRYLRHYQRSSFAQAGKAVVPKRIQREMENLLQYYIGYVLEGSINAAAFLRRLRREGRMENAEGSSPQED